MLGSPNLCVEHYTNKIAIDFQGETITYKELQHQINQLTNYCEHYGVSAGTKIGLCLERDLDALVSLLAILRVGAAFIPLEPAYPNSSAKRFGVVSTLLAAF